MFWNCSTTALSVRTSWTNHSIWFQRFKTNFTDSDSDLHVSSDHYIDSNTFKEVLRVKGARARAPKLSPNWSSFGARARADPIHNLTLFKGNFIIRCWSQSQSNPLDFKLQAPLPEISRSLSSQVQFPNHHGWVHRVMRNICRSSSHMPHLGTGNWQRRGKVSSPGAFGMHQGAHEERVRCGWDQAHDHAMCPDVASPHSSQTECVGWQNRTWVPTAIWSDGASYNPSVHHCNLPCALYHSRPLWG